MDRIHLEREGGRPEGYLRSVVSFCCCFTCRPSQNRHKPSEGYESLAVRAKGSGGCPRSRIGTPPVWCSETGPRGFSHGPTREGGFRRFIAQSPKNPGLARAELTAVAPCLRPAPTRRRARHGRGRSRAARLLCEALTAAEDEEADRRGENLWGMAEPQTDPTAGHVTNLSHRTHHRKAPAGALG